ncbi:hypothetical protein L208DRAFT_1125404, partial [Tricholoma matsutake]
FGGLNMIFTGDFAQLPPPTGKENAALYSRTVGINAVSFHDQESAMGKALWHQVTTVIVLWQNMRQKNESKDDTAFRTALANMRYKACTAADITFLRTRISTNIKGRPCVTDQEFRNVSIITAQNAKKDEINHLGIIRFSLETKQALTHFVSIDTVAQEDVSEKHHRSKQSSHKQKKHAHIPQHIQEQLWTQSACANTKLIPGKLALCVGMPVMIHANSATELSMTKGQEVTVHSWDYTTNSEGNNVLDTLFVCLLNPPTDVNIDGLPPHVVPLIKNSVTTSVRLPDDTHLNISQNQVEILPNFAMTDFASQGKTRYQNIVDLGHSETHQAYYTALSRGSTAAGTLIISGFHPQKIQGGGSGALRQ